MVQRRTWFQTPGKRTGWRRAANLALTAALLAVLVVPQPVSATPSPGHATGAYGETGIPLASSPASWWNANWPYRKPVTINGAASPLTNFQVKVDVSYAPGMQADFDDIRFTGSDAVSLIPYWLESKTDGSAATFWVKAPAIATAGTSLYMYYATPQLVPSRVAMIPLISLMTLTERLWTIAGGPSRVPREAR